MSCETPLSVNRRWVPCGTCASCIKKHRSDWIFRLEQEAMVSTVFLFVTLTYNDDNLKFNDSSAILYFPDLRNYFKRLRKNGLQFKYFSCGEYGEKYERPHFHVIFFFKVTPDNDNYLRSCWTFGDVHVILGSIGTIRYVLKDMLKEKGSYDDFEPEFRPQIRVSKNLGFDYVEKHGSYHKRSLDRVFAVPIDGKPVKRLPRYYQSKIYTKSQLDLQRLMLAHSTVFKHYSDIDIEAKCNPAYYVGVQQRKEVVRRIRHANRKL